MLERLRTGDDGTTLLVPAEHHLAQRRQSSGGWYALRWWIEDFHRVLKTGCRVESRQVRAAEEFKAIIALATVVTVHLLSLVWQARISPEHPPETGEAVRMIGPAGWLPWPDKGRGPRPGSAMERPGEAAEPHRSMASR